MARATRGLRNVLPPGQNGLANLPQLGAFLATGARPPHNDDQLAPYRDLLYGYRGLAAGDLGRYFKDATFGVKPGEAERTYSPRGDVTIVRDRYGVPHIYGATRAGAMFGIGYATAEDRLFFLDVFRHLGRAQLSSFAGGSRAIGRSTTWSGRWRRTPRPTSSARSPRPGRASRTRPPRCAPISTSTWPESTPTSPRRGSTPRRCPPSTPRSAGRRAPPSGSRPTPSPPRSWSGPSSASAAAASSPSSQALQARKRPFGSARGWRVWRDFRAADDPSAPTTVRGRRFPYPRRSGPIRGLALPDRGSVRVPDVQVSGSGSGTGHVPPAPGAPPSALTRGLVAFPRAMSNAILVSARESASGRPLAVFGPQTGYFAPQALMEQEVQAPGISARGVGFPGVNLYVQIGHGRDYAWSATTSAQDIVDTFAVSLCNPDGSRATLASAAYLDRGRCVPFDVLERSNSWTPNAADPTPAGTETLRTERSRLGLVVGRGRIHGRPVAYTRLRSTYMHEPDSGLAFKKLNDPNEIHGPRDFQRAAALVGYTFNWFYLDAHHTAYQNAGANPRRAPGTYPDLPIRAGARYEWRGFNPEALSLKAFTPRSEHPQFIDQAWSADWNNKQAHGYQAADANWGYGPTYRSSLLADRVAALVRGRRKATLPQLVTAMEDAATVDLRAAKVLPYALRLIGSPKSARLRDAVAQLRAWQRDGAHRIDRDRDGTYEHARAIAIFDAWWPRWMNAEFGPVLGTALFGAVENVNELTNAPNNHGDHLGSAWQNGWHGYALHDLRRLARGHEAGWSRVYCGGGSRGRCRAALARSLLEALRVPDSELYGGDQVCRTAGRDGDQDCSDSIWFRPIGGVTQPLIPWVNRPTFQQVVEITGSAGG